MIVKFIIRKKRLLVHGIFVFVGVWFKTPVLYKLACLNEDWLTVVPVCAAATISIASVINASKLQQLTWHVKNVSKIARY